MKRLRAAVVRELEEELAIGARVGQEIVRYEFQYQGRWPIMLMFYRVVEFSRANRRISILSRSVWAPRERVWATTIFSKATTSLSKPIDC